MFCKVTSSINNTIEIFGKGRAHQAWGIAITAKSLRFQMENLPPI